MKRMLGRTLLAAALALAWGAPPMAAPGADKGQGPLKDWPARAAGQLQALIQRHAHQGEYAVFDMDNTSWQYDLTEALLPYLENKKVLTRDNLDPALRLMPFKDTARHRESLYSYYLRLCAIDDLVCYPWIAQSFAGLDLKTLKKHVDEMMAGGKPVPVTYYDGDKLIRSHVNPPRPFGAMQALYQQLHENGIAVYVMTAANEELVRMVASDPRYGYHVRPENVIGASVLLKDRDSGQLDSTRLQLRRGAYDPAANLEKKQLTAFLINPMTWFEGKYGSIVGWIDQWRKPVLVAGDTARSDGYMLLHATDVARGGLRIWVDRKDKYTLEIARWRKQADAEQKALGLPATASQNWISVKPRDLHKR